MSGIKQRDKEVTRAVHRLFWDAMFQSKVKMVVCIGLHCVIFFLNHIYIPLVVAYGLAAIIKNDFQSVPNYAWTIAIASVSANVLMLIATWAFNRNGVMGASYVQRRVFTNYLNKDYDFFANNYIGALGAQAARLRDGFIEYNRLVLFEAPRVITIIVTGLAVIAFNSLVLALITLGCITLIFGYSYGVGLFRLKYRRLVSEASNDLAGVLGDALSQGTTVKSFANESYETTRLDVAINKWANVQSKHWDLFGPSNFGRNMTLTITTVILLIVSAQLYQQGKISIAIIALIQIYVIKLVNTSVDLGDMIKLNESIMSTCYKAVATMMIERHVLDPSTPKKIEHNKHLSIELKDISFGYSDAAPNDLAVKNVSLLVEPSQKIGLVGYSGSGKTTLTKLLMRFMDCTDGSIRIDNTDIRNITQADLRSVISYVPQEPLLFHRSIRENIAYARPEATETEIVAAAKAAYVDEFVDNLPAGYNTLVGERGIKLSGGQRQRVAIARAILKDSAILVLDEATSALDSKSEHLIQAAMWELMSKRTAVVVAHRLSTIQRMDRIVVMDKGKIVDVGTHKELLARDGIYAQLWSHQSGGYLYTPDDDNI
jgi:ATP-binding cassette, subfamily B, bacterial